MSDQLLLNSCGLTGNGQCAFIQRWAELLNYRTLDSYQYSPVTSHSILDEILNLTEQVSQGRAHVEHLIALMEEALDLVKRDKCFERHNDAARKTLIGILSSKPRTDDRKPINPSLNRITYHITHYRHLLDREYCKWILADLRASIDADDVDEVVDLTKLLVSELIGKGHSPSELHGFKSHFTDATSSFNARWQEFLSCVTAEPVECRCYFSSNIDEDTSEILTDGAIQVASGSELLRMDRDGDLASLVAAERLYLWTQVEASSWDAMSALTKADAILNRKMSILEFYDPGKVLIDKQVIILRKLGGACVMEIGEAWKPHAGTNNLPYVKRALETLSKANLSDASRQRVVNLFRQYSLAYQASTPEAWFTGLWIGLESFVNTGSYANIIDHVKNVVPAILCHRYLYRILANFLTDCGRMRLQPARNGAVLETSTPQNHDVNHLASMLYDDTEFNALMGAIAGSCVMTKRACHLKESTSSNERLRMLLEAYYNKVSWHLQRMYRVRNVIAHDGLSAGPNLIPLSTHLNSYLRIIVKEILDKCMEPGQTHLGVLFARFEDNYAATIEMLNSRTPYDRSLLFRGVLF